MIRETLLTAAKESLAHWEDIVTRFKPEVDGITTEAAKKFLHENCGWEKCALCLLTKKTNGQEECWGCPLSINDGDYICCREYSMVNESAKIDGGLTKEILLAVRNRIQKEVKRLETWND